MISGGSTFNAYLESNTDRPAFDSHGMADNDDWGALYLWRNGESVPENQALCPVTTAAMNALPLVFSGQRCPNILFSRLRPGAKIPPHNGMINTRLIGHLPLIIPENCGFRVGNSTRAWNVGEPSCSMIRSSTRRGTIPAKIVLFLSSRFGVPSSPKPSKGLRRACSLQWIATNFVSQLIRRHFTQSAARCNRDRHCELNLDTAA